jgi:hypothetical protein
MKHKPYLMVMALWPNEILINFNTNIKFERKSYPGSSSIPTQLGGFTNGGFTNGGFTRRSYTNVWFTNISFARGGFTSGGVTIDGLTSFGLLVMGLPLIKSPVVGYWLSNCGFYQKMSLPLT